jgi:ATP-dependent Clp protease ATP-binding subunit ClpA
VTSYGFRDITLALAVRARAGVEARIDLELYLRALGADAARATKAVQALTAILTGPPPKPREVRLEAFSPLAAALVQEARELAASRGHAQILPLHLLACAVRQPLVAQALRDAGADPAPIVERLEPALARLLTRPGRLALEMAPHLVELLLRAEDAAPPRGPVRTEELWAELSYSGAIEQVCGKTLRPQGLRVREPARVDLASATNPSAPSERAPIRSTRMEPLAAELLEGAGALADQRGHARLEPIHLLAFCLWHPSIARALRAAGVREVPMAAKALALVGSGEGGRPAEPSAALAALVARAEGKVHGSGQVRGGDLWAALVDDADACVVRVLAMCGATPLPALRIDDVAPEPECLTPVASELLTGAEALAATRGHALVLPLHVLAHALRLPRIVAALDDASADAEVLLEEAATQLERLPRGAPPVRAPALLRMLQRAALGRGRQPIRTADVWQALVEQIVGPTTRVFDACGFGPGTPALRLDEP